MGALYPSSQKDKEGTGGATATAEEEAAAAGSTAANSSGSMLPPTQAPTGMSPEAQLVSLLSDETLVLVESKPDSPQARAFQWSLEDVSRNNNQNNHTAAATGGAANQSDERIRQRFVLAALYYATNGDQWSNRDFWLQHDVHECNWYQQSDFAMTAYISWQFYPGYMSTFHQGEEPLKACDLEGSGLLRHLWLDANNLVGSLPNELYQLTSLQSLSLLFNQLATPLSARVGNFAPHLEGLALQGLPPGTIPTQIGLLTKLRAFNLYENRHSGTLPTELWQLTRLQDLIISSPNSDLRGTIPTQVGLMSQLRWFDISKNSLSGT